MPLPSDDIQLYSAMQAGLTQLKHGPFLIQPLYGRRWTVRDICVPSVASARGDFYAVTPYAVCRHVPAVCVEFRCGASYGIYRGGTSNGSKDLYPPTSGWKQL